MKKITAIICTVAIITTLAACDSKGTSGSVPEGSEGNSTSAPSESTAESTNDPENAPESANSTDSPPESSASEESVPKGEPTFLTCVDGTIIYTSDIDLIESSDNADNTRDTYSPDEFTKEGFLDCEYSVICDGFAYAFTSKDSFNPVQDPELFQVHESFSEYIGEEAAPSSEYYRVEPGDKFGELTVKSARTVFYTNYANYEDKNIDGAYTYGGTIEFDGELGLTGFVCVTKANEGYDEGGKIIFVPDNEYADKIPVVKYEVNVEDAKVQHCPTGNFDGVAYNDINRFTLGNIYDYDIDLDGLEEGERFTRVKITIGDIVSYGTNLSDIDAKLLSFERI